MLLSCFALVQISQQKFTVSLFNRWLVERRTFVDDLLNFAGCNVRCETTKSTIELLVLDVTTKLKSLLVGRPMTALRWVASLLILFSSLQHGSLANVYTCGGFIKSDIPIDFSQLRVKLLTPEGNLKSEAEITPNSGYYMFPVYSKANYEIKVVAPAGWILEPSSISVKIDGETDECTLEKDMNFVLSGFSIEGHVKSGESGGPEGLPLTLSTERGELVAETETVSGGYYSFSAKPGRYLVSTSDRSTQCIERGKAVVEVLDRPVFVQPGLKVSGHRLSFVVTNKGLPLQHAFVTVSSDMSLESTVKCLPVPEGVNMDGKFLCTLRTDATGLAVLPCVPPGQYSVKTHFKSPVSEFVLFEFDPSLHVFTMGSEAQQISIKVLGFSSRGKVVAGKQGISGALIKINGKSTGLLSDVNGYFAIGKLTEGKYTFEAEKERMKFSPLMKAISADSPLVGNIEAAGIDICGSIQLESGSASGKVIYLSKPSSGEEFSATTNSKGEYCANVAPGNYIVAPSLNIAMTPKSRQVTLTSEPLLGISFTQFTASATVAIDILEQEKYDEFTIELSGEDGFMKSFAAKNSVTFSGLPPGSYKVRVHDNGMFCWEKAELAFSIERSDVKDLVFTQIGFTARVSVSHPAKLEWYNSNQKDISGFVDASQGVNSFCVPSTGTYSFTLDSCHKFEKDEYSFVVPSKETQFVKAEKSSVSVLVETKEKVPKKDLNVVVRTADGLEKIIELTTVRSDKEYEFLFYVPQSAKGSEVTIVPQSTTFLFSPTSFTFKFDGSCQHSIASFVADKGVYLEGSVSPPVAGVQITAPHKTDPNLIFKASSDSRGTYKIGPVRNLQDFAVSAELEGYKFLTTDQEGVFKAIRLSQLRINAVDSASSNPLGEVLVSLSGVDNYRSNSIIEKSGKINFVGLAPGEYFLRPFLQEYRFEPNMIRVTIREGEVEDLKLSGIRFAYSAYGKVTQIAGEPVSSVVVEAVAEQCDNLQTEDLTAADGSYRLRGLKSNCVYRISLKDQQGKRLESYPSHYDVTVKNEDVFENNYFLSYMEQQLDVFGTIDFIGGAKPPSIYHVGLYRDDEYVQQTTVSWPSTIFFFANLSIDGAEYNVRLETEGSNSLGRLDCSKATFNADSTFKDVHLLVQPHRKSSDVEIPKSSYAGLALLVILTLVIFNHSKILPFVNSIAQQVMDRLKATRSNGSNSQLSSDNRRSKPRK